MKKIKGLSLLDLSKTLIGHKVRFISDCEFFPNFDITCKVYEITSNGNEFLIQTKVYPSNKKITVGSNMKNLQFELLG
jgi:hypothetical protein